jgi:hypothetical protein
MMFPKDLNVYLGEWCTTEWVHVAEMTLILGSNLSNCKRRLGFSPNAEDIEFNSIWR